MFTAKKAGRLLIAVIRKLALVAIDIGESGHYLTLCKKAVGWSFKPQNPGSVEIDDLKCHTHKGVGFLEITWPSGQ